MQRMIEQIEHDAGLSLLGFASSTMTEADGEHRAIALLEPGFTDPALVWLQFPRSIAEEPTLFSVQQETEDTPRKMMQTMPLVSKDCMIVSFLQVL